MARGIVGEVVGLVERSLARVHFALQIGIMPAVVLFDEDDEDGEEDNEGAKPSVDMFDAIYDHLKETKEL